MHSFENIIDKAKKKEASVAYEFYRLLKNAILSGVSYPETQCEFKDVVPEFPIGDKRADLTILVSKYRKSLEPYLLIEVKARVFNKPGPSIASAIRRTRLYCQKINPTGYPFYAIYDGWSLFIFRDISPYLIAAGGTITDEHQCSCLLRGLEEYSYKSKLDSLAELSKHADPDFLMKRVMPLVAKIFAKDGHEEEQLLGLWKQLLNK